MAIADLLWACPSCGEDRGITRDRAALCRRCGVRYDRVQGARIRARPPDGEEVIRSAAEWLRLLPEIPSLLEASSPMVRRASVMARFATGHEVVRDGDEYLNRIEVYGDERAGSLELSLGGVVYRPDDGSPETTWHFDDLTAVQASSRTLQLKGRGRPLASFAFQDDSSFLWEHLLEAAVSRYYRLEGLGEVVELQPRICVR